MRRFLLAAVSASVLFATGVAQAQQVSEDKQQTEAVVDAYNRAYAEHLGVSVPEAIAYQAKVQQALSLDAQLRGRQDYVGFRVTPGSVFKAEFDFNSAEGAAALRSLVADQAFSARQVRFTTAQIRQSLQTVAATLGAVTEGHTVVYDEAAQTIRVHLRPGSPLRAVLGRLSLALPVDVVEDGLIVQVTADLEGGRAVQDGSTSGFTSGLSVVHSDGRKGITTAGHAPNRSLTFEGASVGFAGEAYGTLERDVQWHSGGTHTYTPHVWVGTGYLTIQQTSALASGVPVCMAGNVNMNRCGRVVSTNVSGTDNLGKRYANAVSVRRDDNTRMASKGDSGAPMITADGGVGRAHGVQFGGFDPINSDELRGAVYVKVADFNLMGVTAQTRPPY